MKTQEFAGRELFVDERPIGNESQRRLRALGIRGHVVAIHQDPARRRLQQPRDDPNGGRLARTVRSEKAVNLPRRHVEADVVHRGGGAVLLDEILNRDHLLIAWGATPRLPSLTLRILILALLLVSRRSPAAAAGGGVP